DQHAAVTAPPGPALVLAGAGSGKTRTLTYRVAWLLHQGVHPWQILLLTFTNKAAREMLGRVEDLTGVPRAHFWGGTFHSVGQRILRRHGEAIGLARNFTILDEGDAEALLGDVVRAIDPAFTKHKEHPKPGVMHDVFSYARNTRQPLAEAIAQKYPWLEEILEPLQRFYTAFQQAKLEKQVADYDDLLEYWLHALERDEPARQYYQRQFRHILVDEFQDTNRLQSDIVDLLAADHQIMAVGDDAQCIYTWRGANFENIRAFPVRHPGAKIYKIEINYRSTPEILRFANGILDHQQIASEFHKHLEPVRKPGPKPVVIAALDTREQAAFVIRRIHEIRANDDLALRDIAVLYRAHYQAMDLQIELSRQGVPFTITSGVKFFEQAHVRDLVAHLRFAHNPRDTVAFSRLVTLLPKVGPRKAESALLAAQSSARSHGKSLLAALTDESVVAKLPTEARGDYQDLALTLQNLEEALAHAGAAQLHPGETEPPPPSIQSRAAKEPTATQGALFDDHAAAPSRNPRVLGSAPQSLRASVSTPAAIVQLAIDGWYGDYLRNIHDNWQSRREDLDSIVGFAARFADMNELLAQLVLLNSETSDRSVDPEADTVRLTTIHQAKGLEFPAVFLIGAAEGLLPLKRAIEEGDVEEERRLFYVASTRAQDQLYVLYPRIVTQGGPPAVLEPSRFLEELDQESFDQYRANVSRGY
ncbi:MAG TPA: ATP-dependent helicase, partial [Opitutales bacterium]|nr:ATP-dependent helicase [Opitutales bacterium]